MGRPDAVEDRAIVAAVKIADTQRVQDPSEPRSRPRPWTLLVVTTLLSACCPTCDIPSRATLVPGSAGPVAIEPGPTVDPVVRTDHTILAATAVLGFPAGGEDEERDEGPLGAGYLASTFVYPGGGVEVELVFHDLSASAGPDLAAGALRELGLRGGRTASPVRVMHPRDPRTRLVALDLVVPPEAYPMHFSAYAYADPAGHVVWVDARCREHPCDLARARRETDATLRTLRPGPTSFSTPVGERRAGDLFHAIDVPAGYTLDVFAGSNEEPPYATPFTITVTPVRELGSRPDHEIVARSGLCETRTGPGLPGSMFGRPMTWRSEGERLCWDEPDADDPYGGIAWILQGNVDRQPEMIRIAATATRD